MQSLPSIRTLQIKSKLRSDFPCFSCQLAFTSIQDLLIHQGNSSPPPSTQPQSETPEKPENTEQIRSKKPKLKCNFCNKKFDDKYTLKYHHKQEHAATSEVECPLCGKVLHSRICYKKHFNACKRKFCEESLSLCRK